MLCRTKGKCPGDETRIHDTVAFVEIWKITNLRTMNQADWLEMQESNAKRKEEIDLVIQFRTFNVSIQQIF